MYKFLNYTNYWLDNNPLEDDETNDDYDYDSKYFHNPGYSPLMRFRTSEQQFIENGGLIANGVWYIDKHTAAERNNLNPGTLTNRLMYGWKVEDAITTPTLSKNDCSQRISKIEYENSIRLMVRNKRIIPIKYDGKYYSSCKNFCKIYNLPYATFMHHFRNKKHDIQETLKKMLELGYISTENDVCDYKHDPDAQSTVVAIDEKAYSNKNVAAGKTKHPGLRIPCVYAGVEYCSIRALADAMSISYGSLHKKIRILDMSVEDAVNECLLRKRHNWAGTKVTYKGVEFNSITHLASVFCISPSALYKHLVAGETPEEAVAKIRTDARASNKNCVSQNSPCIYCFGAKYSSLDELALAFDLHWEDLFDQMTHYGYDPREAVLKLVKEQGVKEYLEKMKNRKDAV